MDIELSRRGFFEMAGVGAARMSPGAFGSDLGSLGFDVPMRGMRHERGACEPFLSGQ